jgi:hypothetical protein
MVIQAGVTDWPTVSHKVTLNNQYINLDNGGGYSLWEVGHQLSNDKADRSRRLHCILSSVKASDRMYKS